MKPQNDYLLEKIETPRKSRIMLNTNSLSEVVQKLSELKEKKEKQFFQLIAIKPSGKIKYLHFK